MSQFKAFYNDWLDCTGMILENGKDHIVNLPVDFFNSLRFDPDSLKQYRTDAAIRCAATLGSRPALCFSGGVDSQAMLQCWQEAKLNFDVIILVFADGLNAQDSEHAKLYCQSKGIPFKEITINIVQFLTRDNFVTSERYKSLSPHFNTHYRLVEILSQQGYTGACFGGMAPYKKEDTYGYNFDKIPMHYVKAQDKFDIPMQGNFLSFSPELCWAIALQTPEFNEKLSLEGMSNKIRSWEIEQHLNAIRYEQKLESYQRAGFDVIRQDQKYTGFELVKKYFEKLTGDGWTFEKRFRYPLTKAFNRDMSAYKFFLSSEQYRVIASIHRNNLGPSLSSSTGIGV